MTLVYIESNFETHLAAGLIVIDISNCIIVNYVLVLYSLRFTAEVTCATCAFHNTHNQPRHGGVTHYDRPQDRRSRRPG